MKEIKKEEINFEEEKIIKKPFLKPIYYLYAFMVLFAGIWIYAKYNITFTVDSSITIATATISIMINIIVLGAVFVTGIGQKVFNRFMNRLRFKSGKFANTIFITKNGTSKELFKKVDADTGTFRVGNMKYIRNPLMLINFEKIPTYFHREGNPDPLNIWQSDLAGQMSNAEMDIAMSSAYNFDLKQFIEQHKMIVLLIFALLIAGVVAGVYLGVMNFQMLRDGTYTMAKTITTNVINQTI